MSCRCHHLAPAKSLGESNGYDLFSADYLPSTVRGQFMRLYLVLDVFSRMIVGWEVHWQESSENAAQLITKACLSQRVSSDQLVLHSDNGSPVKGATMLATLQRLGVVPSFSRPSVSDDNPYSEAMFRTLKFTPAYPHKPFESREQARAWVHEFVTCYNTQHRHSRIGFVTPAQRHAGQDAQILSRRKAVYEAAKCSKPGRWKYDAQLGTHQRGLAEPTEGEAEVAMKKWR